MDRHQTPSDLSGSASDDELSVWQKRAPAGTRVVHAEGGYRGTVRAVAMLPRKHARSVAGDGDALALGIEWDEPRGVHDGKFQGRRLFECKPKHGSFVGPNKVHLESGLDEVLLHRFTDAFGAVNTNVETLVGSKDPCYRDPKRGNAFIHVWNVDCTASPSMACVSRAGPALATLFPSITRLSVTSCLLQNWVEVAKIIEALPLLESLSVRDNPLGPIDAAVFDNVRKAPPSTLTSLNVSTTRITPKCVGTLIAALPTVSELYAGGNRLLIPADETAAVLQTVEPLDPTAPVALRTLSLDNTGFASINQVRTVLGPVISANLETLNLNQTHIASLDSLGANFPHLSRLMVRECDLDDWDALLPVHEATSLEHLCFSSQRLDGRIDTGHARRQHIVAVLPKHVTHLNRSYIRETEWNTARQAVMTAYVAQREQRGGLDSTHPADHPQVDRRAGGGRR
jgi:hypothetical protein